MQTCGILGGEVNRPIITRGWRGKCQPVQDLVFVDITEQEAAGRPVPVSSRSTAQVLVIPPPLESDPLHVCLDHWMDFMRHNDTDLGVQGQKNLIGEGDGYGNEDTSTSRRSNEIGEATNAMILSLKRSHQWAIRHKCGMAKRDAWRFPQLDFMTEALDACEELEKKLRDNIATRVFFD